MTPSRPGPLLSLLPLALGLGACVDAGADSGLTILHVVPAEAGCTFTPGGDTFSPAGIIESDALGGYLIAPEVRNDLTVATGENLSTRTAFVTGAQIELEFYDPDLFSAAELDEYAADGTTRFLVPFGASIEPGGTAVIPFEVVPVALLREIGRRLPDPSDDDPAPRATIDVRMRVVGSVRGSDVESNLFRFPVQVCNGCLTQHIGRCVDLSSTTPVDQGGVCQLDQDLPLDCCDMDRDHVEVDCKLETPRPGFFCDNDIDDPTFLTCPARPPQM